MSRNLAIFLLTLKLSIFIIRAELLQKYVTQTGISINSTLSYPWLIGHYNNKKSISCLIKCNLISSCYMVAISNMSDDSLIANCTLYSKYFSSNELVSLSNTNLYYKECNIVLSKFMINF